ncbi:hypothetical protein [Methylovirgula sp. 4M-Z18]|uniref:hypothetical protein n=1 Tax=Methylovirgula sp. 4M-Z18 TaxID=2293567 RepID=UPI000E2FC0D2|nr:hypothetical protein [Methylovirgula sp. 4M-Z18]RFB76616.1 hypothetical protein DYH55_19305 [Methylovirgula sp. 4M-Z18]
MIDRTPTDDERAGMAWWNVLTEPSRQYWMRMAGNTGIVADAWAVYKQTMLDDGRDEDGNLVPFVPAERKLH